MEITAKNKFIVANKKDEHYEKDRELFLKVLPYHKLAQDFRRENKWNKHIIHGQLLFALLDKVSEKEILENRSAETKLEPEKDNRFAELVKKFISAGISVNEIVQKFISENPGDAEVEDFISEALRFQKVNAIRAKFTEAGIDVNPEIELLSFQLVDENASEEEVEAKIAELKSAGDDTAKTDTKPETPASENDGTGIETETGNEQPETAVTESAETGTGTETQPEAAGTATEETVAAEKKSGIKPKNSQT